MGIIFTGSRHSIRPSLNLDFANSKALDPRITFTRASNATYYDGYTSVKAEENLLEYSEDISVFGKTGTNATLNTTTAPDGTTTADKLISNGVDLSRPRMYDDYKVVSGRTYTHSIFAKASEVSWIKLRNDVSGAFGGAFFNLSTGSVGTVDSGYTASIVDAGNGWYRCIVTHTASTTGDNLIGVTLAEGDNDITWSSISSGDGVFLWGAQAEERDTVTAYTATSGTPITKYQPALQTAGNNVARFDHNPTTGESLGLLIEESRTNLLIYSEDFSNANWNKLTTSITSNTIIAPDGTLTGDKIIPDNGSSTHYIYESMTVSTGNDYVASVYAKKGEYDYIRINNRVDDLSRQTWFNLSNGTVGTVQSGLTASIQDVGNGWYRCSVVASVTSSTTATMYITPVNADNTTYISSPDGYSGIFIWGATYEQGSFPTSYIKTTGSQVTRSADDAVMNNIDTSDWYKFSGYSFYAEGNFNGGFNVNVGSRGILGATQNGSASYRFILGYNGTDAIVSQSRYAGTSTTPSVTVDGDAIDENFIKVAISLDFNNFISSANGATGSSSTNLPSLPNLTDLRFGRWTDTNQINGCIKKVSYYPIHLTQNEINDLTEE